MAITHAQMLAAQDAYDAASPDDHIEATCEECGEIPGTGDCVLCALVLADAEDEAEWRAIDRAERGAQ